MAELSYLDFDLSIEGEKGEYKARVLNSPAGQAIHNFSEPFSELELENFILRIGRPRQGVRRIDSPEMQAARLFGERLFQTVFRGEVYACYRSSLSVAKAQQKGLRVRLRVNAQEYLTLPWEYLYNSNLKKFLSLSIDTPIVRYLDLPHRPRALVVEPPLKILVMISSPSDFPELNVDHEWKQLKSSLRSLERRGLVSVERLDHASLGALQRRFRIGDVHIFHYIGHGKFDEREKDGLLVFEDENGRGRPLSGNFLGTILQNHRALRLVVLNACEGARASVTDPYSGAAQSLVCQGIPAVVAMQFEVTDKAAITFSREFYGALADGYPVDAALVEARTAIFADGNDIEWGTPVYFTHADDGCIFNLEEPRATTPPRSKLSLRLFPLWFWALIFITLLALIIMITIGSELPSLVNRSRTATPVTVINNSSTKTMTAFNSFLTQTQETPDITPSPLSIITNTDIVAPSQSATKVATSTASFTPEQVTSTSTQLLESIIDDWGVPMVFIPAGEFLMGSDSDYINESPMHTVFIDSFYLDIYEVTNARYTDCVNEGRCSMPGCLDYLNNEIYKDHPVVCVKWDQAQAYCAWRKASLPSEAQWEKAARGGLGGALYPWGYLPPDCKIGSINGTQFTSCDGETISVGSYAANDYGVYDMAGNVWEWVMDWYSPDYYRSSPSENPIGPAESAYRVLRGGSWDTGPGSLRVANRHHGVYPNYNDKDIGFRCARIP